jgi:hypothetical protein
MFTTFSKNLPKSKIAKSTQTPVDTVHDITQRPLQYIQEPTMDEDDCEEDHHKNIKSDSFDGESLSTHGSVHVFHNTGILICNEEGKILHDDRSETDHVPCQDLDKGRTDAGQEKQTGYPVKDDDIDLSFHLEDSLCDSSDLYRALGVVDEGEGFGDSSGAFDSPRLKNENEHFEGVFANLGQVMFKNQPGRIVSDSKSTRRIEGNVQKKLFDSWTSNILPRLSTVACFLFGVAATYTVSTPITMKGVTTDPVSEGIPERQEFAKEVFLQAMYMLSTFPQCNERDVDVVLPRTSIFHCLPYAFAILIITAAHRIHNNKGGSSESYIPSIKKSPRSLCKTKRSKRTKICRFKREMASLDRNDIVPSTFITEIVTPTGELSSVKRSSRIEGRKMKDEVGSSRVNLTGTFHLEYNQSPSKTQITEISNE